MSNDLRREIAELQAMVEALQPSHQAEDYLRERFAAPEFDEHREQIVAALLGPTAQYSFSVQLADDPDDCPSRFMLYWPDRSQPVMCIHVQRVSNWGGLRYAHHMDEVASYDQQNEPPVQAVTALVRSSYGVERAEQTVNTTPSSAALSDLALVKLQPHSEQDAEPPAADAKDVVAQIAAIQARIAQLTAEEQQPPASAPGQQTSPSVTIVEQPAGARAVDWARRLF